MMYLATIRALSAQTGRRAVRDSKQPYHPESLEDMRADNPSFRLPSIGTHCPKGWKRTTVMWFVDSTGLDRSGPALTYTWNCLSQERFIRALREHFQRHPSAGYAVTEEGQFQVYVTAFERRADQPRQPRQRS